MRLRPLVRWVKGYRVGEVPLPAIKPVKGSTKVKRFRISDPLVRPVVAVSIGANVKNVALPKPDPDDSRTMLAGVAKRFAYQPPFPDRGLLEEFKIFVGEFLKKNFVPLSRDTDLTFETWIEGTSYPDWRKDALRDVQQSLDTIRSQPSWLKCNSFMKDEHYVEYKHARGINSRSDEFKTVVGPWFAAIEKVIFKHRAFIKKIPVQDRPKYIFDLLYSPGGKYAASDYTAFESQFTREIMEACEFQMYEYMTQFVPDADRFMELVRDVLGGENVCRFKNMHIHLEATRMSGEMCTSLGNGFSNLMFLMFICSKNGATCEAVVEGDDALASIIGPLPTAADFAKLGLDIKLEIHDNLNEASFCGLVFDLVDMRNVTDPRKVLASFGWLPRQYAKSRLNKSKSLLRCKALSLAYQYPGCPILSSLARYGLRVTRGIDVRYAVNSPHMPWFQRQLVLEALKHPVIEVPVGMGSRLLVEKLFKISVSDQKRIECYLDGQTSLGELDCEAINRNMSDIWIGYYLAYGVSSPSSYNDLVLPFSAQFKLDIPLSA